MIGRKHVESLQEALLRLVDGEEHTRPELFKHATVSDSHWQQAVLERFAEADLVQTRREGGAKAPIRYRARVDAAVFRDMAADAEWLSHWLISPKTSRSQIGLWLSARKGESYRAPDALPEQQALPGVADASESEELETTEPESAEERSEPVAPQVQRGEAPLGSGLQDALLERFLDVLCQVAENTVAVRDVVLRVDEKLSRIDRRLQEVQGGQADALGKLRAELDDVQAVITAPVAVQPASPPAPLSLSPAVVSEEPDSTPWVADGWKPFKGSNMYFERRGEIKPVNALRHIYLRNGRSS